MTQELTARPPAPVGGELLGVEGLSVEIANADGYQPALSDVSFTLSAALNAGQTKMLTQKGAAARHRIESNGALACAGRSANRRWR